MSSKETPATATRGPEYTDMGDGTVFSLLEGRVTSVSENQTQGPRVRTDAQGQKVRTKVVGMENRALI